MFISINSALLWWWDEIFYKGQQQEEKLITPTSCGIELDLFEARQTARKFHCGYCGRVPLNPTYKEVISTIILVNIQTFIAFISFGIPIFLRQATAEIDKNWIWNEIFLHWQACQHFHCLECLKAWSIQFETTTCPTEGCKIKCRSSLLSRNILIDCYR